jgi:hypothetical protein
MVDAGALGTIQLSKTEPFRMLDGYAASWEKLPVLPDIKLAENQYNEIKGMVEKGETVELEFDIRNWFKMGPIKYHNVIATLRGTTYPDEYVVIGGHFDCFSGATGGVDDGSGFAPGMEAIRLIKAAANAVLRHDAVGVLGASAPNAFYLTLQRNPVLDKKFTAIGKVIAGLGLLQDVKNGDAIRSIRITRVGQAARDFKTDDETFQKLLGPAGAKK